MSHFLRPLLERSGRPGNCENAFTMISVAPISPAFATAASIVWGLVALPRDLGSTTRTKYLVDLPASTSLKRSGILAHQRSAIEQQY